MNVSSRLIITSLLLMVFLAGCSSRKPGDQAAPRQDKVRLTADPAELLQALQERNQGINSLRSSNAEFRYRFTTGTEGYDGTNIRFAVKKPGMVYARASATGVGDIFYLHSNGRQYWVEDSRDKKVYTGTADDSSHMAVVESDELWRNLTPSTLADALLIDDLGGFDHHSFAIEPDFYIISLFTDSGDGKLTLRRRIWFNREDLRVLRHRVFNVHGELATEAYLYRYEPVDGVLLPHYFRIERHWESISITFTLEDIVLNSELPDTLFNYEQPPADFEMIDLDKRESNAKPGQS